MSVTAAGAASTSVCCRWRAVRRPGSGRCSRPGSARAAAHPSQGRSGSRMLVRLLERYPEGERAPESKEERRLLRLLSKLPGLPPVPQLPLTLLNGDDIRVDAGYPWSKVAV